MSAPNEAAAAAHERGVRTALERLHREDKIDPHDVRAALIDLDLGVPERDVRVRNRPKLFDGVDSYVDRPGSEVGIVFGAGSDAGASACLSGTVSPDGVDLLLTGPYPESGCFPALLGH
jgi:hypothetical protein